MFKKIDLNVVCLAISLIFVGGAVQARPYLLVQSTTSTQNSGLYEYLVPLFEQDTGIGVRVVAVGTGQAIRNAQNCDGDVLLVHARAAEEAFVEQGFGLERFDLMYNDFVLIGPKDDPAGVVNAANARQAFTLLFDAQARVLSRGDDSGTHKKELALWRAAKLDPKPASGNWYWETGAGMGATLNVAVETMAYVMTDRATWIAFARKNDHEILFEGDPELFNQYGIIAINPDHCPKVEGDKAKAFVDWMIDSKGQSAIAAYRRFDQQLFFPNAE